MHQWPVRLICLHVVFMAASAMKADVMVHLIARMDLMNRIVVGILETVITLNKDKEFAHLQTWLKYVTDE
jgi:hypothetical protein